MSPADDWDPFADPADEAAAAAASSGSSALPVASAEKVTPERRLGWYSSKPVVVGRPIRVAVLHGTASNGRITQIQLMRLEATCKGRVEFVYVRGHLASDPANHQYALMSKMFPGQELYQFLRYTDRGPDKAIDYLGMDEAASHVQAQLRECAPIDGLLGFSQGSNLAALLAAQAAAGVGAPLAFVVHCAGNTPGWSHRFPQLFSEKLRVPSLHIAGEQDTLAPGHGLGETYWEPELLTHTGEHRPLPRDRDEANALTVKMLSFMERAAAQPAG